LSSSTADFADKTDWEAVIAATWFLRLAETTFVFLAAPSALSAQSAVVSLVENAEMF
jgi:hypothetical protein